MPVYFTWGNGGETVGLIPTRYPGSQRSEDPLVQMSRKTDWIEHPADLFLGIGQRMLATDTDEYPLMDIREIILDITESEQDSSEDTAAGGG